MKKILTFLLILIMWASFLGYFLNKVAENQNGFASRDFYSLTAIDRR